MQPVRKASENIYSSQAGLNNVKPEFLGVILQLHFLKIHNFTRCMEVMVVSQTWHPKFTKSQICNSLKFFNYEITNSRKRRNADHEVNAIPKITVPQLQYPVSQIHALNVAHDCLTSMTYQILKYANFSNTFSQIHGSSNITSQDHVSSNTISQVHNFTYFTKVMVVSQAWRCKFLVHNSSRSGQKPPKIFAPPFEIKESGSIPDSIKPSSISLYIHVYTIVHPISIYIFVHTRIYIFLCVINSNLSILCQPVSLAPFVLSCLRSCWNQNLVQEFLCCLAMKRSNKCLDNMYVYNHMYLFVFIVYNIL